MTNYSRTTLRELKKRYLNVLKKCFLLNLGLIFLSSPVMGALVNNLDNQTLTYTEHQVFNDIVTTNDMSVYHSAVHNRGNLNFTSADFVGNKSISTESLAYSPAIHNGGGKGDISFSGDVLFRNNYAEGFGAYGGAIYNNGTITFGGLVTFEENIALSIDDKNSDGGAINNSGGSVVFEDTDNNAETPAVPNITYGMTFKGDTLFIGNKAESETTNAGGGAIYNSGYMLLAGENTFGGYLQDTEDADVDGDKTEYVLDENGEKISLGNQAKNGGAIYNSGGKKDGDVIAYGMTLGKSNFMGNTSLSTGGAVYNSGYMNFTDEALFEGNGSKAGAHSSAGAIYNNRGAITFDALATFEGNSAIATGGNAYGGAIRNEGANAVMIFNDEAQFKNNTATATGMEKADGTLAGGYSHGGAINNSGTITFDALATFEGNTSLATGGYSHGGAIINSGANAVLTFNDGTQFKNNTTTVTAMDKVDGTLVGGNAHGGAISNVGSITFGGLATFEGNTSSTTGGNAVGGAISNSGTITFDALATFEGNTSSATGGNAAGGAIYNYNNAIINFNNSFTFTNNKTISKGVETPNDISNNSTINFAHGLDKNGVALIGSLDGGISNNGIINKTGAGTLILGDEMVNSGTGTFNQSAGLTIAHADHFLTGTNNITGGELRVHGANMSNLKVTVGENALLTFLSTSTSEIEMKLGENVSVAGDVKFGADESVGTAKYHLKDDIEAKKIIIENADVTTENETFEGAYVMGENVTLDMQDGDTADSVGFANLSGESSDLLFDIELKATTGEGLELESDKLSVQTPTAETYKVKVDLAKINVIGEVGDNGLNETYTTKVLEGEAEFETATNELKVFTDVYKYDVTVDEDKQSIKLSGIGASGENALKEAMDYEGNSAFKFSVVGKDYAFNSDTPITLGSGEKNIVGQGVDTSTIASGDKKLFVIDNENTNFKISDVALSGTGEVIENKAGNVTLEKVAIEAGKVINKDELKVEDSSVHVVENAGTLTANGSEIGALVNGNKAEVTGGKVTKVTNKGELTVTGATITELMNEQEAELTASTVEDLTNTGKMTAKDLTLKGALKGTGTATLSGKLVADDIFKSENKIISDGMEVSENVKKMELADLEIKEGTTLDIGTREVTAKDVKVGDKATLQVTLNGLDEHGTMKADKIEAGAGAGVHLVLGEKFEGGVFDVFKGTKGAGDLEVKHNNLYNVIEVSEGKYSFMTKDTEALQESLGATKEEVSVADAMTKGTSTNPAFNKMQSEMLIALQSLETDTVAKAKKALSAVGSKEQSIEQSVASEHLVALQNVVQAELHGTTVGHSGGEEDPRAKVYIKGLYDRTKSSMGEGFRARSKGAVLGVQSEVTEDLTLGVGYATSQTTAKEDLRRTEVDTNTGFVSAHYQPNAWWVSGLATFSRGEYEEEKQILSSVGKASYNVDSWGAQVMTGYDIKLDNAIITPEVGLRYLSVKQEGYTDTLGTTVSGTRSDYLTALVGVKGTWDMGAIRPTAGVTVGYDVISDDVSALNTLANGASYTVNGEALDRLSTTVTTGIEADLGERTTLKLEYSGTFRKEYADHSGMLKLEVKF